MYQKAGVPDIIACINGKFVAIEVKRSDGVVSPLQQYNIEEIHKSGGEAFVAYSFEEARKRIDALRLPKESA
jgi:Holliday junction resolvase